MKPIRWIRGLAFVGILVLTCTGSRCSLPWIVDTPRDIVIVSYNAHNLFDDVDDGTEYPEFDPGSSSWNSELYAKRLEKAAFAIRSPYPEANSGPDILCLVEIENSKVLKDLASGALAQEGYQWSAIGGPERSPIKCGILSRIPIVDVKSHGLVDAWGLGGGREILEACFELGKAGFKTGASTSREASEDRQRLSLFLCHWKSRKEGAAVTEESRRASSRLVAARILERRAEDPDRLIVVCGDFNESPDEFARIASAYPTAFMPSTTLSAENKTIPASWFDGVLRIADSPDAIFDLDGSATVYSPWAGVEGYSYVFQGEKERLDGFLLGASFFDGKSYEFRDFRVGTSPELMAEDGSPLGWNGSNGYSDHLPIALKIAPILYSRGDFMDK